MCSSSIAADRIKAIGLANPLPAMSGALPWTASNTAILRADVCPRHQSQPADQARAQVADHVAEQVLHHQHVELRRVERQLQAQANRLAISSNSEERIVVGHLAGRRQEQARR